MSLMKEEYRISSNFHCYINIVERIIKGAPTTIQCRDKSGIHEFDIEMENVSIGIDNEFMLDRLIRNGRDRITKSGYATYTDKRHHGISNDLLTRKCGIGIDKENHTLQ